MRELRFRVEQPGFRVNQIVLATTILDATEYPKEEVANLYFQRWNVEEYERCVMNRAHYGEKLISRLANELNRGVSDSTIRHACERAHHQAVIHALRRASSANSDTRASDSRGPGSHG